MKSILSIFALAIINVAAFGQTDSAASETAKIIPAKSTFTLAAVYSNNANYYGQKSESVLPYIALAANYQLKSGFYFTGQTFKLLNDNSATVSAASFGAGVNFKLSKKLSTDLNYSHSFYPKYSPLLQAASNDNASASLSYDSWIQPTITGDYAFGKTNDAFVTGSLSKVINLFSIGQKDIITISPAANLVAGTQHFYQSYITQKKLRDSIFGILTDPIFGSPSSTHVDTVATTSFNILSYNLKLPLAYNRAHYTLEAAYQLSLLSDKAQTDAGKVNSFVTFSFYYQF